jgi:hypothetical protein
VTYLKLVSLFIAWVLAAGAVLAVALVYDSLPAEIPLSRWEDMEKTPFLALRVPLINLVSLALIEVFLRPVSRLEGFGDAATVAISLYLTMAAKALLEGAGLVLLPHPSGWTLAPLIAALALGLGFAIIQSRSLWQAGGWRKLQMKPREIAALVVLTTALLGLNLPLMKM